MLLRHGGVSMIDVNNKKTNLIIINPTLDNLINTSTDHDVNTFIYDTNGIFSLLDNSSIFDFVITYVDNRILQEQERISSLIEKHHIDYINKLFVDWLNVYNRSKIVITLDDFVKNSDIQYLRSLFGRFMVSLKNILRKSIYLIRLPENFLDLFEQLNITNNDVIILVNIDKYLQPTTIDKTMELIKLFNDNGYDEVYVLYNIIDDTLKLTNFDLTKTKNCCIITTDGRVYFR
jgi:hypothetical protein